MSDISKINPNGTEYNLKDATARTNIGNLSDLNTTEKTDLVRAVNEVNNNITKLPYAIAGWYGTTDGSQNLVIHFSGIARTRATNYVLHVAGQSSVKVPIYIGFTGLVGGIEEQIKGLITSDLQGTGVSVSGTDLIVNCSAGGGWGIVQLYKLLSDSITITSEYVSA